MTESKKGVSAKQMERTLCTTYRTAWHLCHRIRSAVRDANAELLRGIVEVDGTYVGGKTRGTGHGYRGNKSIAIGAVQRGGKICLQVIDRATKATLHKFIADNTAPDTQAIYTEQLPACHGIAGEDTRHESVNHSKEEEWVRGDVHTNGIESIWSLLKRSIVGAYHKASMKHLDAYLDELEHRFNNRKNEFMFRDTLTKLVTAAKLPYRDLVKAA